jgi:uncharacterized protein YggT (Ycf19 family)
MAGLKILLALYYFTLVIQYMILAYVVLSWFSRPGSRTFGIYRFLGETLEPLFAPFRKLTSGFAMRTGLDFTPFITVIAISAIYHVVRMIAVGFLMN